MSLLLSNLTSTVPFISGSVVAPIDLNSSSDTPASAAPSFKKDLVLIGRNPRAFLVGEVYPTSAPVLDFSKATNSNL